MVFNRVLEMSDDELKNVERNVLSDITTYMDTLLRPVYPKETPQLIGKFELAIAYKVKQLSCGSEIIFSVC